MALNRGAPEAAYGSARGRGVPADAGLKVRNFYLLSVVVGLAAEVAAEENAVLVLEEEPSPLPLRA